MPTINDNKLIFDSNKYWVHHGEEWSGGWGGSAMQWYAAILPRIFRFLPAQRILDLGAGQGRFAQFLKDYAETLVLVDLSENCIEACKQRFAKDSNIEYFVNDGKSLNMIENDSIDFVFSHDALVFVEEDDFREYVTQLAVKIKKDGLAFLHHSNLGQYWYYKRCSPNTIKILKKLKFIEDDHWRAYTVSADKVRQMCNEVGLECIVQELIPWCTKKTFVDCYSLIAHKNSVWSREPKIYRNIQFDTVKRYIGRLARFYHPEVEKYQPVPVTYNSVKEMTNHKSVKV
jgi:ubiquinone/menaquinone biosynthesis C-methylase UbiE